MCFLLSRKFLLNNDAWPDTLFAINILVDGRDGKIVFKDTVGAFQYASPLVFDFTRDGFEDVLVTVNIPIKDSKGEIIHTYGNHKKIFDIREQDVFTFEEEKLGSNLGSIPPPCLLIWMTMANISFPAICVMQTIFTPSKSLG